MRPASVLIASAALALLAPALDAQLVFEPPRTVGSASGEVNPINNVYMFAADVNGDGHDDLLAWTEQVFVGNQLVLISDGAGGFETLPDTSPYTRLLGVGDLDEDGYVDLLVPSSTFGLAMQPGNGDGTFADPVSLAFPDGVPSHWWWSQGFHIADLDGDGHLDLVSFTSTSISQPQAGFGDGQGSFSSISLAAAGTATSLTSADLDSDGRMDVLYGGNKDSMVTAMLGVDGVGTPTKAVLPLLGIGSITDMAAGDLDGDGDVDLVVGGESGAKRMLQVGPLDFLVQDLLASTEAVPAVVVASLDDDDHLDVALTQGDELIALRGLGDGSFAAPVAVSGLPAAGHLVIGEFSGAGPLDLIVQTLSVSTANPDFGTNDFQLLSNASYAADSGFADLGHALPGGSGWPILIAGGTLAAGSSWSLDLYNAPPGGQAVLILGLAADMTPFKGGVCVPRADLLGPMDAVPADGALPLGGPWLASGGSGTELYAQWWIADPGAPAGWAASNAARLTVP